MALESTLMSESYNYSQLCTTYHNFITPACKIKIADKDIVSIGKMLYESVSITLSVKEASTVNFRLINLYDREASEFRSEAKNLLKLGNKVTVELGYESSLEQIFVGYIHEVSTEFSDIPSVQITAVDIRRLMMDYKVENYEHKASSYSDAFECVMEKYSKLCSTKVDGTEVLKEEGNTVEGIVQQGSDYNFVDKVLCKREEREFFIFDETAYYRKIKSNSTPIMTLEWGNGLIYFSKNTFFKDTKIEVIGYDWNKEPVTSSAEVSSDSQSVKPISKEQKKIILIPSAKDKASAEKQAKREAEKEKEKSQQGQGRCIGLPQIVPGRFLTVDKLDDNINGTYYISKVNHSFGSDGFTTSFEIGGYQS